jgi:hypothetical protein
MSETGDLFGKDRFTKRNDVVRLEMATEMDDDLAVSLHAFYRVLGAPHLVPEQVEPAMAAPETRIFTAVRDQAWPPTASARKTCAVAQVQEIGKGLFGLGPIHVGPADDGNLGMQAAVLREALEFATSQGDDAEVAFLVREGSVVASRVLLRAGFRATDDVVVKDEGRYFYYRAPAAKLAGWLGFDKASTPELLATELDDDTFDRVALLVGTLVKAGIPRPWDDVMGTEILVISPGLFNASLPGGVPPTPPTALARGDLIREDIRFRPNG